jgi:SAM-dependent methyltransferase
MDVEVITCCPICGSTRLRPWHAAPDRSYGSPADEAFAYARCRDCSVRFLQRRPTAATAGELYDDRYAPYDVGASRPEPPIELTATALGRGARLAPKWIELLRETYRAGPGHPRFLDIGCGSAHFLTEARARGWNVTGADFSPAVVTRVRAAGIDAHLIDEVWAAMAALPVDLIRMNHVLEHLYEPHETLARARDVLAPGGKVHVAIPNPVGLSAALFRRYWMGLEPRHVIQYPPARAADVLRAAGFAGIEVVHQPAARDVRRSLGHAMAELHAPGPLERAVTSGRAEKAYALPAALAARVGRGDRIHLVARKS